MVCRGLIYCNGFAQSVAKQRLGKENLNNRETFFYGVRAATIDMQWLGKHVSTTEAVFTAGSVQRSYLKNKCRYDSVLSSKFSVEGKSSSKCD
jgi:uncharacterized membrane protein